MNISNHNVLMLTGIPLETLRMVRSLAVVNLYGRWKFDPIQWLQRQERVVVCELIARNNNKVSSL